MNLAVFDLDGTLTRHFAEDEESFVRAFSHAFRIEEINCDWPSYEHHTDLCVVGEIFRGAFGRPPTVSEYSKHTNAYMALLKEAATRRPSMVTEIPGARSLLNRLEAEGAWACAIATGGWECSARFKLAAAGFSITFPLASGEDGPSREEIVRTSVEKATLAYSQTRFDRIVLLGDGPWDVRTAQRLGLPVIAIVDENDRDQFLSIGARHLISDYCDFDRVMACLNEC